MNKKLLPALIVLTFATSAVAEPDIFGRFSVNLQHTDEQYDRDNAVFEQSIMELRSNHSRLGFKGTEEIGTDLTVLYHYELRIDPDDETTWEKRNSFLGIKGNFGTVRAGRFDSALKSSQGKIDIFGDLEGDLAGMVSINDTRIQNAVSYSTPNLNGFAATVDYIMSETEDFDPGVSAKATYTHDMFYVALAHDIGVEAPGYEDSLGNSIDGSNATRLTALLTLPSVQLGAMFETYEPRGENSESVDGFLLSAKYSLNNWDFKAQYGSSDIVQTGGITKSIGIDYRVTKNFTWMSFATTESSDQRIADTEATTDNTYIGFGGILTF